VQTKRSRVILAGALLVFAAGGVAAGCKKDKKPDQDKPGKGAAAPVSDDLRSVLAMMPLDSDMIAGVDVAALRNSELYKAYQPRLESLVKKRLKMFIDLCGFDPVPKVQRAVIAADGGRDGDATIVVRGLGKGETIDCLNKAAAAPPEGYQVAVDGDFARIDRVAANAVRVSPDAPEPQEAPPMGESASLQFIGDETMVLARRKGEAVDKAAMQAVVALPANASVTASPGFMEMLDAIDTDASVWLVVDGKAESFRKSAIGRLQAFDAAFGHIQVGSGLDIDVSLRVTDPTAAAELATKTEGYVTRMRKSLLKGALGEVKVEHSGRDVRFRVQESRQQLEELYDKIGGLLLGSFGD
jgi:hypothetical protein